MRFLASVLLLLCVGGGACQPDRGDHHRTTSTSFTLSTTNADTSTRTAASVSPGAKASPTASATTVSSALGSAVASAAPSATTPVKMEARDPALANCCTAFNAYRTGYVADRGPNMSHVTRKCVALWELGYDRTRAEPILKPMAEAGWRWPRACVPPTN